MKINLINENFTENYVENLLAARGVENVKDYFNPGPEHLQSPLSLKNIRLAGALYTRVVTNGGRVLVVVDSDCDGYTSAAIIYQYTQRMNPKCVIDYWLHEGKQHGLQDHIDRLMEENCEYDLIILPDSSSNDATYHDMLEEVHIPCLILDHHLTDVKISDNAVIVNNQLSPDYKNKELTGAGVVYQFCRYIDSLYDRNWADDYVDLAALGVIGDMGSMVEMENRFLSNKGLSLPYIKNDFFKCLLDRQSYSITGKMNASWEEIVAAANAISVAFYIVPLINAMIRVGTMPEKERLFRAFINGAEMVPSGKRGEKGMMTRVDVESARECTNAKNKQNKTKELAVEKLEAKIFKYDLLENKILFVRLDDDDKFPSELNGLIAMNLSMKYKKPTIVARLNKEGIIRGSMRGLNNSPLVSFKKYLDETGLFEYVSGHDNAAGVSIPETSLSALHKRANQDLSNMNFGENVYDVNFMRASTAADLYQLVIELGKAESIWGQSNPQPLVYVTDIQVSPSSIRIMGANQDTLKIEFNGMSYIKFHAKEMIEKLKQYRDTFTMEVVGKPNLNTWMGRVSPQMFIEDYDVQEEIAKDLNTF